MIKIISQKRYVVTCPECETVFSFEKEDTSVVQEDYAEYASETIACPVCGYVLRAYKGAWGTK